MNITQELKAVSDLEIQNTRLRKIASDVLLDIAALKERSPTRPAYGAVAATRGIQMRPRV
jgi:hypothetical protein